MQQLSKVTTVFILQVQIPRLGEVHDLPFGHISSVIYVTCVDIDLAWV